MTNQTRKWESGSIAGITAITVYVVFTLIAYLLYPKAYSPIVNWLSQLGNPLDSPYGSWVYRAGCIIAAVALIIFYIRLRRLNSGDVRMKVLLIIAQVAGVLASVALIVTGIFPFGTETATHSLWSMILYISLAFFEAFSAAVFLRYTSYPKWIGYLGITAAAINFVTGAFFTAVVIGEWITVAIFILYIAAVAGFARLKEQT